MNEQVVWLPLRQNAQMFKEPGQFWPRIYKLEAKSITQN